MHWNVDFPEGSLILLVSPLNKCNALVPHVCISIGIARFAGHFFFKGFSFSVSGKKCLDAINVNFLSDKMPERKVKWACQVRCSCNVDQGRERLPNTVACLPSSHTIMYCMRSFICPICLFLDKGKERLILYDAQCLSQPSREKKSKKKKKSMIKWENRMVWFLKGWKVSSFPNVLCHCCWNLILSSSAEESTREGKTVAPLD